MSRRQTTTRSQTLCRANEKCHDVRGIEPHKDALELVRRARARSQLTEGQALSVAQPHVKALRAGRKAL